MIAIVDCNNFYASCERLFNPKIEKKPVVVLSNNDGCVIARSQEAKDLGIEMGAPAFMIREQLQQVEIFSSNYTLYGDLSARVMQTLAEFSPVVENYSIDESFLELSHVPGVNLFNYAKEMRRTVLQNIGIPVSIGIATSKTLAKMANRIAKKAKREIGVHVLDSSEEIESLLRATEVEDIWGVGRQHASFLRLNKVKTAWDLRNANEAWVRKNMSVVGARLQNELKGIPCIQFEELAPPKQGICTSRSFGKLLTSKEDIKMAVSTYAAACAKKLRKQNTCAGLLNVFIQTNMHRTQDQQYFRSINMQLPTASNLGTEIVKCALKGFDIIFKPGLNYNKAGVMVMDIVPQGQVQKAMFDTIDRPKHNALAKCMDELNTMQGRTLVQFAVQGQQGKGNWQMLRQHLSPCYTTRLKDVLIVKK